MAYGASGNLDTHHDVNVNVTASNNTANWTLNNQETNHDGSDRERAMHSRTHNDHSSSNNNVNAHPPTNMNHQESSSQASETHQSQQPQSINIEALEGIGLLDSMLNGGEETGTHHSQQLQLQHHNHHQHLSQKQNDGNMHNNITNMNSNMNNGNKRTYAQFMNPDPMNQQTTAVLPTVTMLEQHPQAQPTLFQPLHTQTNNPQQQTSRYPQLPLNTQHQQNFIQNQIHQMPLQAPAPTAPLLVQQQQPTQTTDQIYHISHNAYSTNDGTTNPNAYTIINTDQVSDARRKMNHLVASQSRAEEELKNAQHNLEIAKQRVDLALQNLNMTNDSVKQGTEDLTDALLQEPTHWNAMYRKLAEYKETHGHVDVKRNPLKAEKDSNPDAVKLGAWVGRVRLEARRPKGHPDHIEPYKVIALDRIGFDWDPRENYWQKKFEELKEYICTHPESKMPTRKTALGVWCDGQVLEYNKFLSGVKPCYITQQRINQLNSIGFVWNRMGNAWAQSYQSLKQYRNENGHCHVPVNHGDKTLFRWIAKQRKKYRNFKEGKRPALTEEQVKLLEEIDFFEPSEVRLAKYNAQKEKEKKFSRIQHQQQQPSQHRGDISSGIGGKIKISSSANSGKRGRPVSTSLIPQEAQEMMASRGVSTVYPNSFMPMPVNYPIVGSLSTIPQPVHPAISAPAQESNVTGSTTASGGLDVTDTFDNSTCNVKEQGESNDINAGDDDEIHAFNSATNGSKDVPKVQVDELGDMKDVDATQEMQISEL